MESWTKYYSLKDRNIEMNLRYKCFSSETCIRLMVNVCVRAFGCLMWVYVSMLRCTLTAERLSAFIFISWLILAVLPARTAMLCFPPETQTTNSTLKTEPDTPLTSSLSLTLCLSYPLSCPLSFVSPWLLILYSAQSRSLLSQMYKCLPFLYNLAWCHCDIWKTA